MVYIGHIKVVIILRISKFFFGKHPYFVQYKTKKKKNVTSSSLYLKNIKSRRTPFKYFNNINTESI